MGGFLPVVSLGMNHVSHFPQVVPNVGLESDADSINNVLYVYFLAGFELSYFLFYILFVVNYITVSSMTTAAYVLLWLFSCMYRPAYYINVFYWQT